MRNSDLGLLHTNSNIYLAGSTLLKNADRDVKHQHKQTNKLTSDDFLVETAFMTEFG